MVCWSILRTPPHNTPPIFVYRITAIRHAVRVFPVVWPVLTMTQAGKYRSNPTEQINAHRTEVAECRGFEAAALVFWPPLRGTFLPNTPRPAQPEGAITAERNEEPEEEPEG